MLRPGDTVALLALSSPARSSAEVDAAVTVLESFQWNVRRGSSLTARRDYLAGTDALRVADFHRALGDPAVRGIFFLRGGYGSGRLLPDLDLRAAKRERKLIAGFSDLTSLLNALDRAGLATLHMATMASHFVERPLQGESRALFHRAVAGAEPLGGVRDWPGANLEVRSGASRSSMLRGRLLGGNLEVFCTLLGTRWMPKPNGRILFLEEVHEKPYAIDRSLTHLRNAGYLDALAGIVFGQFTDCEPPAPGRWNAREAILEALRRVRIPVLFGVPSGHGHASGPIPFGVEAELHSGRKPDLVFLESFATAD